MTPHPEILRLSSRRSLGWLAGTFRCPIEGLGMVVARTFAGMYEVFAFPVPIPQHYQPLLRPEFVWQPETFPAANAEPRYALPSPPAQ